MHVKVMVNYLHSGRSKSVPKFNLMSNQLTPLDTAYDPLNIGIDGWRIQKGVVRLIDTCKRKNFRLKKRHTKIGGCQSGFFSDESESGHTLEPTIVF